MEARLRSMWTAGPAVGRPCSSITVAARRGATGVSVPSARARIRSGHSAGIPLPVRHGRRLSRAARCSRAHRLTSPVGTARRRPAASPEAAARPPRGEPGAGLPRPAARSRGGRAARLRVASSTWISTSTGASSGSTATPTALRACTPLSPSTSPSSSLAPFSTPGCPVKSGAEATKPTTFTTRATRSRSPATDFTAASAFSAQVRASSLASSAVTSAPTLPVTGSLPSTIGSWPEV